MRCDWNYAIQGAIESHPISRYSCLPKGKCISSRPTIRLLVWRDDSPLSSLPFSQFSIIGLTSQSSSPYKSSSLCLSSLHSLPASFSSLRLAFASSQSSFLHPFYPSLILSFFLSQCLPTVDPNPVHSSPYSTYTHTGFPSQFLLNIYFLHIRKFPTHTNISFDVKLCRLTSPLDLPSFPSFSLISMIHSVFGFNSLAFLSFFFLH